MSKSISKKSDVALTRSANRLKNLLMADPDARGQLYDARICNDISIDLYQLRQKKGLTQKELAEKLNVKQSNISRWEKPGYQGYKVKMLSKIVRVLGGKLYISVQPMISVQYCNFDLELEDNVVSIYPDGTQLSAQKKAKIHFEGVSAYANTSQ